MEAFTSILGTVIVTLLSFITNRLVKNIDERFEKMEKNFNNLKSSIQREADETKAALFEAQRMNEALITQVIDKNLRYARKINEEVSKLNESNLKAKDDFKNIYGTVIQLKSANTNNQSSIAIQQKKLDILYKKLTGK